jgi:hypothetical protein
MTDWSVIVNLNRQAAFHMGVTGVGEVPIALQAWRSLRGAEESSYPAYVGYSVRCAPFHVIASEAKQSIVTSRAERWIASLRSQ